MKVALKLEYDGTRYHGWQGQQGVATVQAEVERALSRVADAPVEVVCAGRTDAGVHATGQVVHFETGAERAPRSWVLGANSNLPADVSVVGCQPVEADFHARFSAVRRAYRYVILNRWVRSAVHGPRVTWWHRPLDVERMRAASTVLLGTHDFTSFRASECQAKSPVRTLERLEISRSGDFIHVDVQANAFLHHMVRNLVGSLLLVGQGDRDGDWLAAALEARDRRRAGMTAPARGLYLVGVGYPERFAVDGEGVLPAFG